MLLKVFGTTVMIHNLSTLVSRIQAEEKQCSSNGILDCVKMSFALQHRQDPEAEKKKF